MGDYTTYKEPITVKGLVGAIQFNDGGADLAATNMANVTPFFVNGVERALISTTDLYCSNTAEIGVDLYVHRDAFIDGNLFVYGNITVISTNTLVVEDPIVEIANNSPDGTTAGIVIQRPSGNVMMGYLSTENGGCFDNTMVFSYTNGSAYGTKLEVDRSNDMNVFVNGKVEIYRDLRVGGYLCPAEDTSTASNLFVDTSLRRVGIIQDSPSSVLTVGNATDQYTNVRVINPTAELVTGQSSETYFDLLGTGNNVILSYGTGANEKHLGIGTLNTNENLYLGTANTTRVTILSTGEVGLDNVAPDRALVIGSPANVSVDTTTHEILFDSNVLIRQINSGGDRVAIGSKAGQTNQSNYAVAVGLQAGNAGQHAQAVAIGRLSGKKDQRTSAVAIGNGAGETDQKEYSIAIGHLAGNGIQQLQSVAIGYNSSPSNQGQQSVSIGSTSDSRGLSSTALGHLSNASASSSTALGHLSKASGSQSTALGYDSNASATNSIALGFNSKASASSSTALGHLSNASGSQSTALGKESIAFNNESTAVGWKSNAYATNSTALGRESTASGGSSTALGYGSTASGSQSTALGRGSTASGDNSTALGYSSEANKEGSTALGYLSNASGSQSTALGKESIAYGGESTALGWRSNAYATNSTALGRESTASGGNSIALGRKSTASADNSTALGYLSNASASNSTALGHYSNASGTSSIALGYLSNTFHDNTIVINANEYALNTTDTDALYIKPIRYGQDADTDNVSNVLSYDPDSGQVIHQYPQSTFLLAKAKNGDTILKGNTVYIVDNFNDNVANVGLADATNPNKMPSVGIALEDFSGNGVHPVVTFGKAKGINTSGFIEGETLYVSNTVVGGLTNVKPTGGIFTANPDLIQNVGFVVKSANNGTIKVTGVGRTNDIPNANVLSDDSTVKYVYVNTSGNDLKKIDPAKLVTGPLTLSVSGRDMFPENNVNITTITGITGSSRYAGGVLAPNGNIYGVPYNATNVLIIDPVTDTADTTTITGITGSSTKYAGGVLAPNGKIYCVPHNASNVAVIKTGVPTEGSWILQPEFNKL